MDLLIKNQVADMKETSLVHSEFQCNGGYLADVAIIYWNKSAYSDDIDDSINYSISAYSTWLEYLDAIHQNFP